MTDPKKLGFGYRKTPFRFQAEWDGSWSEGGLIEEPTITIEEGACCLHYGQQCFEGLKAQASPDGTPLLFRIDQNRDRLYGSAERLLMPPLPPGLFERAVRACVYANRDLIPGHGSGGSLYVRPLILGVGDNLGLRPAPRYVFRVFCSPVGPYFKDGGLRLWVHDEDRVAPRGTGAYKVGGNYAGGFLHQRQAKNAGYDEVLYLDALHHRGLEEAGAANVYGVLSGLQDSPARLVTPESESILPSITMDSVLTLARDDLGLAVERRKVVIEEVRDFLEMGCTGTAAVITPVALVHYAGKDLTLPEAPGPVSRDLYRLLTGVQTGIIDDTRGWVSPVTSAP